MRHPVDAVKYVQIFHNFTQVIIVGQPTRLNCNYVKQRSDSVHSVRWYAGYSGVKSKILDLTVETGDKETSPLSFITVDEDSATDDEVSTVKSA